MMLVRYICQPLCAPIFKYRKAYKIHNIANRTKLFCQSYWHIQEIVCVDFMANALGYFYLSSLLILPYIIWQKLIFLVLTSLALGNGNDLLKQRHQHYNNKVFTLLKTSAQKLFFWWSKLTGYLISAESLKALIVTTYIAIFNCPWLQMWVRIISCI